LLGSGILSAWRRSEGTWDEGLRGPGRICKSTCAGIRDAPQCGDRTIIMNREQKILNGLPAPFQPSAESRGQPFQDKQQRLDAL
jgi:hypothetical protein